MRKADYVAIRKTATKVLSGLVALFAFVGENEQTIFSDKGVEVETDKLVNVVFNGHSLEGRVKKIGKRYLELMVSDNRKVKINIDKILYVEEM